jgi:hypothetical protein
VYTREAHPGEHRPAHASFEDKLSAATRLRDELGISRPILVDDFEGAVHLAYGGLPNMSWVLGRGGPILYKAMWTSAERVGDFLERYQSRPLDLLHAPFFTEQLEVRRRDAQEFTRGLERNGPRAVAEFARAEELWGERARAARRHAAS